MFTRSETMNFIMSADRDIEKVYLHLLAILAALDGLMYELGPSIAVLGIAELLQWQFTFFSGGRMNDGSPIITLPPCPNLPHVGCEQFIKVLTYLTSIAKSSESSGLGFIVILDRRYDKWSSIKSSILRISSHFPSNIQAVFVLKPTGFVQKTVTDLGFRFLRDSVKSKMILLNTVGELHGYIPKGQLTNELGGDILYHHSEWIQHRQALEGFWVEVQTISHTLELLARELAETELPNGIADTEALLFDQRKKQCDLVGDVHLLEEQGRELVTQMKLPSAIGSTIDNNPEKNSNASRVQRMLVQLEETEKAFDELWRIHESKLKQCLQLRYFEQEFREMKTVVDELLDSVQRHTETGDSVCRIKFLMNEHKMLEEKSKSNVSKVETFVRQSGCLVSNRHYAMDCIEPKLTELQRMVDEYYNSLNAREDVLDKSLDLQQRIENASRWCNQGVDLLASQLVDKCQSKEGAEGALKEIEDFLRYSGEQSFTGEDTAEDTIAVDDLVQRITRVHTMFDNRRSSLKRLASRDRPVQPVAGQRSSTLPINGALPPIAPGNDREMKRRRSLSWTRKGKNSPKPSRHIEVMLDRSHGELFTQTYSMEVDGDMNESRRKMVMKELLDTEKIYVDELLSVIEGYANEMDDITMQEILPAELIGQKHILFGNLEQIQRFHRNVFLNDLEEVYDKPSEVGKCFLNRQDEFQMYGVYCQNKPSSEALIRLCGENCSFFTQCQTHVGHKLTLSSYLLKPVQRITKYQLLLREMLKYSVDSDDIQQLESAMSTMLNLLKYLNDIMHQIAITGFQDDLTRLGKLLMQGPLFVEQRRGSIRDLRPRTMQRHVFLYESEIIFCKRKEDSKDENVSYVYKQSVKTNDLEMNPSVKGDKRRFEIGKKLCKESFILQAPTLENKFEWIRAIKRILMQDKHNPTSIIRHHSHDVLSDLSSNSIMMSTSLTPLLTERKLSVKCPSWNESEGVMDTNDNSLLPRLLSTGSQSTTSLERTPSLCSSTNSIPQFISQHSTGSSGCCNNNDDWCSDVDNHTNEKPPHIQLTLSAVEQMNTSSEAMSLSGSQDSAIASASLKNDLSQSSIYSEEDSFA